MDANDIIIPNLENKDELRLYILQLKQYLIELQDKVKELQDKLKT